MSELQRFIDAQNRETDGLAAALEELGRGRKHGHWIWWVFPQLAGLGRSEASRTYALSGWGEAEAYLRHEELHDRYAQAVAAVSTQLCRLQPPQLDALMGSRVDALKLVSSLTLFEQVATSLAAEAGDDSSHARLAEEIGGVLAVADAQGYDRCAFTQRAIATPDAAPAGGER
jgi:uncharacterized protein (DUF1810 family)